MSVSDDVQQLAEFIRVQTGDVDGPDPHLWRLLARGEPVAVDRLAAAVGWTTERVRQHYAADPDTEWDQQGRIEGSGLTLRPTPHSVTIDGATVYGWCATDVLYVPILMGKPGVVKSTCPATGRPIRAEIAPASVVRLDPPEAVVTAVRPTDKVASVRAEVCSLGNFFASRQAAAPWLEQYPKGVLRSVSEDFEIGLGLFSKLGWSP